MTFKEFGLKIAVGNYADKDCLKVAKYMARANIDQLLGGASLGKSRQVGGDGKS